LQIAIYNGRKEYTRIETNREGQGSTIEREKKEQRNSVLKRGHRIGRSLGSARGNNPVKSYRPREGKRGEEKGRGRFLLTLRKKRSEVPPMSCASKRRCSAKLKCQRRGRKGNFTSTFGSLKDRREKQKWHQQLLALVSKGKRLQKKRKGTGAHNRPL